MTLHLVEFPFSFFAMHWIFIKNLLRGNCNEFVLNVRMCLKSAMLTCIFIDYGLLIFIDSRYICCMYVKMNTINLT